MLLEHRIILEDYEKAKIEYSKILTNHVIRFNKNSQDNLEPYLAKLKKVSIDRYNFHENEIEQEFKNETITKYEFWIDAPFLTIRRNKNNFISNQETDLLRLIYEDDQLKDFEN